MWRCSSPLLGGWKPLVDLFVDHEAASTKGPIIPEISISIPFMHQLKVITNYLHETEFVHYIKYLQLLHRTTANYTEKIFST